MDCKVSCHVFNTSSFHRGAEISFEIASSSLSLSSTPDKSRCVKLWTFVRSKLWKSKNLLFLYDKIARGRFCFRPLFHSVFHSFLSRSLSLSVEKAASISEQPSLPLGNFYFHQDFLKSPSGHPGFLRIFYIQFLSFSARKVLNLLSFSKIASRICSPPVYIFL